MKAKKNPLFERMREKYADLSEFCKVSGVPVSSETCRRAIYEDKPISTHLYILIAKYLGFTPKEIKGMLTKMGEKEFSSIIGDSTAKPVDVSGVAVVEAIDKITSKDPALINGIALNLEIAARAAGVDISDQLVRIKRKKRRG